MNVITEQIILITFSEFEKWLTLTFTPDNNGYFEPNELALIKKNFRLYTLGRLVNFYWNK